MGKDSWFDFYREQLSSYDGFENLFGNHLGDGAPVGVGVGLLDVDDDLGIERDCIETILSFHWRQPPYLHLRIRIKSCFFLDSRDHGAIDLLFLSGCQREVLDRVNANTARHGRAPF